MKVSYPSGTPAQTSETAPLGFFLSNKKGAFCCFGIPSRYQGWFAPVGGRLVKILDEIALHPEPTALRNEEGAVIRERGPFLEEWHLPEGMEGAACMLSSPQQMQLLFDVKAPYDSRVWGRFYSVRREGKHVLLEFTKKTDSREDSSSGEEEFSLCVAISAGAGTEELASEWVERGYAFDEERNSPPVSRYVFHAMTLFTDTVFFGAGITSRKAIEACEKTERALRSLTLKSAPKRTAAKPQTLSSFFHVSESGALAARRASLALSGLLHDSYDSRSSRASRSLNKSSLYAGLPWFFQEWSRDTLVSVGALILEKRYDLAKELLMRYVRALQPDGTLLSKEGGLVSADAFGWLSLRLDKLFSSLEKKNLLSRFFKKRELEEITERLEKAASGLFQRHTRNHLAVCEGRETWLVSIESGGACIELQAQRLQLYDFLFRLTKKKIYADLQEKLRVRVRTAFWDGAHLKDGSDDATARPNVFIAAYTYPALLSAKEWERCFDALLPKLWLSWGGLSTIDASDSRFHAAHTGENPESYHNGDSWYWLNNLAALVLFRLNPEKYKLYWNALFDASVRDILWQGFSGAHSELSSAAEQKAGGCLNQAWSDALFLELAYALADKRRDKHFK
ncbi:MAG: amylo-alpha-1,6-glucosidase [Nanoarchaeota archaeon]|nr:amylo-alpha-1,6-glucosidase [Nanoarchaeota archaeon]